MIKVKDVTIVFIVISIIICSMKSCTCYRILCLHGSGGSGQLFEEKLTHFIHFVQRDQEPVSSYDASSISGLEAGNAEIDSRFKFLFPTAPFPATNTVAGTIGNRVWWQLPEGKRSFNANHLNGIDESLHIIDELAPFDVVISFSQGAMLAAVYLSNRIIKFNSFPNGDSNGVIKPLKCIFIGAGVPSCYNNLFDSVHIIQRNADKNTGYFKTLHVVGRQDTVNPTYMGEQLASIFNGQLYLHDGGHIIPSDYRSLEVIRKFIVD